MIQAAEIDESNSRKDTESLAALKVENSGLRELLKIAHDQGSLGLPTSQLTNEGMTKATMDIAVQTESDI